MEFIISDGRCSIEYTTGSHGERFSRAVGLP
jgi:hypothetical protein